MVNSQWRVTAATFTKEDENYWRILSNSLNRDSIYFIADFDKAKNIEIENILLDVDSFTDTKPDYRANLKIKNESGFSSSYQSEYPYRMTKALGSLYSACDALTDTRANSIGLFLKNIHCKPIKVAAQLFLVNRKTSEIKRKFDLKLNESFFADLTEYKLEISDCYLFARNYIGIPVFVSEYDNGSLSFEHTHPPHEFVTGSDRYKLVHKFKEDRYEEISKIITTF
jgi:hypothetical protein